jgi:hypothetical protein
VTDDKKDAVVDKDDLVNDVVWSSQQQVDRKTERRNADRRQVGSRAITVPDMRSGIDRRSGEDRRNVRLTITGRAMDA